MNFIQRLGLGLCVVALILVGGCKKKNKKLIQYRSTDFIFANQNYSQKKVVEKEEDKKTTPIPTSTSTPTPTPPTQLGKVATKPTNTPVPGGSPVIGGSEPFKENTSGSSPNINPPSLPPETVRDLAYWNKLTEAGAGSAEANPVLLAQTEKIEVAPQVIFDQEISKLVSCGQSFKAEKSNPPKIDWPSCFTKTWNIDSNAFCTNPNEAKTIIERQGLALERAKKAILMAQNMANYAEIQRHKLQLESIPQNVAATVALQAMGQEKGKYVFPTGVKQPLKKVLQKYQALLEIEDALANDGSKGKKKLKGEKYRTNINNKLLAYNNININTQVNDLFSQGFLRKDFYNSFLKWDQELKIDEHALVVQELPPSPPGKSVANPKIELQQELKENLAKVKQDLQMYINGMLGPTNSTADVAEFLRTDPVSIAEKSIEITGWPFSESMRLNVVDMMINPPGDSTTSENAAEHARFRERLYNQFYDYYVNHDAGENLLPKDAFAYFASKEKFEEKMLAYKKLPAAIKGLAQEVQLLGNFTTWQGKTCYDFASQEGLGEQEYDCKIDQILISGQQNPAILKQAGENILTTILGVDAKEAQNISAQSESLNTMLADAQKNLKGLLADKEFCKIFEEVKTDEKAIEQGDRGKEEKKPAPANQGEAEKPAAIEGGGSGEAGPAGPSMHQPGFGHGQMPPGGFPPGAGGNPPPPPPSGN